jgi:hypothetical protein
METDTRGGLITGHVYPFDGVDAKPVVTNTSRRGDMKYVTARPEDIVNEPSHYARYAIQPKTFIMRNKLEFWRGNIVKYACRAGFKLYEGKNAVESEIIDLEKAINYCQSRIKQLNGDVEL